MEDRPTTIRVYPGELRAVYYTSVLASHNTTALEVSVHRVEYRVYIVYSVMHEICMDIMALVAGLDRPYRTGGAISGVIYSCI